MSPLSPLQSALAALPGDRRVFLEGLAGTGKTTAGVARLLELLRRGVSGADILVLLPQRTLATPYTIALRKPTTPAGGEVTVLTLGGLAQRMVELFWPLVAAPAGFARPDRPPVFLTLETAQYFMARLVRPLLDTGSFDGINVDRNRLYSQILDNLNKAAVVGFPHTEIGERLKAAWVGQSSQLRVYDEAQACADGFRDYCLAHNLLDFSLQYELFARHLWPLPACRAHLLGRYRHLIVDNVEEDTPVAHDLLLEWLPRCASALVIYDIGAGYRRFLGADPTSAYRLKAACEEQITFNASFVMSPQVASLGEALRRTLGPATPATLPLMGSGRGQVLAEELDFAGPRTGATPIRPEPTAANDVLAALDFAGHRYHPEMLDWVADRIAGLVADEGVRPGEIAVLAPFVSGGLRFSLEHRLAELGIAVRSHRPSRALSEEPTTMCLLTLATLCHPGWATPPNKFDVAYALMLAIGDMDLVRAQLLADIAYRVRDGAPALSAFAEIEPDMQERITFVLGGRYEGLRTWLAAQHGRSSAPSVERKGARRRNQGAMALDHFLARLFGEMLSQPGYGFHDRFDAGEITAKVIESARKFRQVMDLPAAPGRNLPPLPPSLQGKGEMPHVPLLPSPDRGGVGGEVDLGKEYVQLVRDGVVAAQHVQSWQRQPEDAVLIAPAYTFLMNNRPVEHQFWLDVGGTGWWERLYQPLTQPYVLSRRWQAGSQWTDLDEYVARQEALSALALGLVRRCRKQVHLGLAELGESGSEQRGPLLRAIQSVLRTA